MVNKAILNNLFNKNTFIIQEISKNAYVYISLNNLLISKIRFVFYKPHNER